MRKNPENYAFIDSQNLNLGIQDMGWKLDFKKFRIYLAEKYGVSRAFLFLGFIPNNQDLYTFLQSIGFIIVFKPILDYKKAKGNCDAELVLQAMVEFPSYHQAVIVSGDGDFHCLVKYLLEKNKLKKVLAPSHESCSVLLTRLLGSQINFVSDLQQKLSYTKKRKKPLTN